MNLRIADTFTDSLARLTGEEQKAAKMTAFDLQINPSNPGMSFHKIDKAKDCKFWSVRVNADIRIIVHRTTDCMLLCYVDHHDKAYNWAERRKLETHPKTGAAQLVEIRETVKEVIVPVYIQTELPFTHKPTVAAKPPYIDMSDAELLGYGVPIEWLQDVKNAPEETLYTIIDHLPAEAAEALLELATGGVPRLSIAATSKDPFDHPDAQRRFRIMENLEELQAALEYPWDKWTIFLHPDQRAIVERDYSGPTRVSGSAGTGKTIVALHRAAYLARKNQDSRVLLTTFSDTLANALYVKLKKLLYGEPRLMERIDVHSINAIGVKLYKAHVSKPDIVTQVKLREIMLEAANSVADHKFALSFLLSEWDQVVDARQLNSWEAYRDVARLGRKTRLSEAQRQTLWSIFEQVLNSIKASGLITYAELFKTLADLISKKNAIFDHIIIDEAQDISISQLLFCTALAGHRSNGLFFAGDIGQRIFQQPFSWKSAGVDIQGRCRTLRVNYRTSHQIRSKADRLLNPEVVDADGNSDKRNDTVSVFNGPEPTIQLFATEDEETAAVAAWILNCVNAGVLPHEFGVVVRSANQFDRAQNAVRKAFMNLKFLDDQVTTTSNHVSICTMHMAKGLEFRAVVVMACDDEIIPLQERIENVGDNADLQEVYDTERHLLYVACTRARDYLLVTAVNPASEFIDDLTSQAGK